MYSNSRKGSLERNLKVVTFALPLISVSLALCNFAVDNLSNLHCEYQERMSTYEYFEGQRVLLLVSKNVYDVRPVL